MTIAGLKYHIEHKVCEKIKRKFPCPNCPSELSTKQKLTEHMSGNACKGKKATDKSVVNITDNSITYISL